VAAERCRHQHDPAHRSGSSLFQGAREERRAVARRSDQAHPSWRLDLESVCLRPPRGIVMPATTPSNVGKLTVSLRTRAGKGSARSLRAQGKVPGVCYGATADGRVEPLSITVDVKALRAALDPVRKQNTVIDLTIDGDKPRKLHALVKEYQIHPLRRDITHVDLLAIDPNKEVDASVPIEFTGK